jgi:hypothetical protein
MSTSVQSEQAVLDGANAYSTTGWTPNKPKIIEFYGHEGEDFRHFKTVLETFFSLTGITQDQRRVAILRTQIRRAAATFFDNSLKKKGLTLNHVTYKDVMKLLEEQYITSRLIQNYELAFSEMMQANYESPREFLSRLYEAADLAEISEEKFIHSRFRAGLKQDIKTFCREQSACSFEEWVKHATGWWNAHSNQAINLVDNPFIPSNYSYLTADNSRESLLIKNNRILSQKNLDNYGNVVAKATPLAENLESPTIAALSAKLEALDLKQLVSSTDNRNYLSGDSSLKGDVAELFESNKSIRSLVKSVVQELMVEDHTREKEEGYKRYGKKPYNNYRGSNPGRRRNYYQNEMHYENDTYNPGEGYYRPDISYGNQDFNEPHQGRFNNQNRNQPYYHNDYQGPNHQSRNNYNGYNNDKYAGRNNYDQQPRYNQTGYNNKQPQNGNSYQRNPSNQDQGQKQTNLSKN